MHHPRCFKLFLVVCTRGSDVVDREEVRTCQLRWGGRWWASAYTLYRGAVDGVEDKEEGGNRQTICRYWDCAGIVIV